MLESILAVLHNATTLLFGVYISAAFLGVRMNRHNVFTLLIFSGAVGIIYIAAYLGLGTEGTEKIYPLIIHLPLVLFLSRYYKYKPALSVLSVLTAYLCCQISKWVGLVAMLPCPRCGSTTRYASPSQSSPSLSLYGLSPMLPRSCCKSPLGPSSSWA